MMCDCGVNLLFIKHLTDELYELSKFTTLFPKIIDKYLINMIIIISREIPQKKKSYIEKENNSIID